MTSATDGAQAGRPWADPSLSPDERARLLEGALTEDERHRLLHSHWATAEIAGLARPSDGPAGAGYTPPIPRLGVPALCETDASLGVTNPGDVRPGDRATALPSGLALAAGWNPCLALECGAVVGEEAAKKGFNVLLGGGCNLTREPRCGRNFEYLGEDPLLAGAIAGEFIRGAQAEGVICTAKHFALNDQETGRHVVDATIDEAALRESDLLAFQIAIERGRPGAIMSAYNRLNGAHACENEWLLNTVLKNGWAYPSFVMSDWGGTSGVQAAAAGLDRQSGEELDHAVWFDGPLREAIAAGTVPAERVSEMARRILRSIFAAGLFDRPSRKGEAFDEAAHQEIAQRAAEQGIVLLKNDRGLLPIASEVERVLVVGGLADVGVLSGAGSAQVTTGRGPAAAIHVGGEGAMMARSREIYHPSSPLRVLRQRLGRERLRFCNGRYPSEAAAMARDADLVLLFATQWTSEGADVPDLSLPNGQDALIAAIGAANSATVVVLETGGPVLMPWLADVAAVLAAWYPGERGGEAIARVLLGEVCPSGRLPISFPRSVDQLPRPVVPGTGGRWASPAGPRVDVAAAPSFVAPHPEGSDVGYRWYARTGASPLFPFGFGLSYTRFAHTDLELAPREIAGRETLLARFAITNTGARAGADVAQVYLTARAGAPILRLIGFSRIELEPGESRRIEVEADPRLLADFDVVAKRWRCEAGPYEVGVGDCAEPPRLRAAATLRAQTFAP